MRIAIPEIIREFKPDRIKSLSIDGLTAVEYKQYDHNGKVEVLIGLILKGKKHVLLPEGECNLEPGDIYFFRKGNYIVSEIFSEADKNYEALQIYFPDELISEFAEKHSEIFRPSQPLKPGGHYCIFKSSPLVKSALESFLPYFSYEHPYLKDVLKLKIQEILLNLMGQENGKELKAILLHSIPYDQCRLTDVMESNYTKPYRLEDFARLTCRSLTKFKKDFKETYRIPPKEWIHQKRLEKAKQMINDITADSKGGAYFTMGGVYYANPKGEITKYGENITPNGIILSADEKTLYVTNGMTMAAFDVQPDGSLKNQREFAQLGAGGGDGSTIDAAGRVYVTYSEGIAVLSPEGKKLGTIPTPRGVITAAFGGKDKKMLYILARGAVAADGSEVPNAAQVWVIPMLAQGFKGRAK